MFLVSAVAFGVGFSSSGLARINVVGDWSAFAKLSDILRNIGSSENALMPHATATRFRRFLDDLVKLLNSAYDAVSELSKTASAVTCSVNEEVDVRLVAADSVKVSFTKLSKLINDFSGYFKPIHIREAAEDVALSLQRLAFDRWGWLGNIRRYCFLSSNERERFLLQLGLGGEAIYSVRHSALALHNGFER